MTCRAAVALSEERDDRAAGSAVGAAVATTVGEVLPRRLAILAVAPGRDPSAVCQGVQERLGGVPVLGLSSPVLLAGGEKSTTGVGLLLLAGTHTRVTTAAAGGWSEHPARAIGHLFGEFRRLRGGATQQYLARSLLVLSDTPAASGQELVDAISSEEGLGFRMFGAALARERAGTATLLHGTTPMSDSVVAAEILADRHVGVCETSAYRVDGEFHRVTAASGPLIRKIDGLDAASLWSPDDEHELTFATYLPDGSQRLLGRVAPATGGALQCPGTVASGSRVQVARFDATRHPQACRQAVSGAIASLTKGVRPAALLAIVSSAAHSAADRDRTARELDLAAGDTPILGLEACAAIARLDGSVHSFHTASTVVCAFPGD